MKKFISIFLCAALAFAACGPVVPDNGNEPEEYAGNKVKVSKSSEDPISADGGTLTVTVSDCPEFSASLPKTASWLKCTQSGNTLSFNASANTSAVLRYAHVSIIDKELNISITSFDVVQAGTEKEAPHKSFRVSVQSLLAKAGDTSASFNINGEDVAWTVTSSNPVFVPDPASGVGNAKVTLNFPANTTAEEVTSVITVSTTDEAVVMKELVINVKQEAGASDQPAVKPAPGTVLAEWEFDTPQVDALKAGGIESVSLDDDNAPGNVGNPYIPSNVSGKGKLEYFNGSDKSSVSTKKPKRRIGERGELAVYCSWEGDWFTWTAETDAPLAAGTKFQLNFVLRPSHEDTPKYWKCEYLDGDKWVELETISLEFHKDAADTAEDPKQINTFIKETATLTADTPYAQFRFTCTQNARCYDGAPVPALTSKYVLRFAGKWSDASDENKYLQVPENPKIVVVE